MQRIVGHHFKCLQRFQHFEQNIGTQTILSRVLEKMEKLENDAQRFFAECWKIRKVGKIKQMMPNDSLQNVGKIEKVGKLKSWKNHAQSFSPTINMCYRVCVFALLYTSAIVSPARHAVLYIAGWSKSRGG